MIATDTEIIHFIKIYQERNLTRAAFVLNLTQPTLTQSLVRLETKLQSNLFIRTKQGCIPTEAADIFYSKATQLQDYWNEIKISLKESQETLQGNFRLGCHSSMGAYLLPELFKNLYSQSPLINLQVTHDLSRNLTDKVIQMELDFAFVANPHKHPDLVIHKLCTDHFSFWKNGRCKNIPEILYTTIAYSEIKKNYKNKMKPIENFKHVHLTSLELIRTLTNEGAGIGYMPARVAGLESSLVQLKDLPSLHDDICLIYRVGTMKSTAAKTILSVSKKII